MTFIDPRSKVLRHLDRVVGWQEGEKPAPVSVEWDLSNRCVLGCQDCHFAHTHSRGPWTTRERRLPMAYARPGDLADLALVERVVGELAAAGVQSVIWSGGGEPTTHPRWLDALRLAHAAGLEQGMYTLGGLFTEETAREAAGLLSWVVVSLDAADPQTYAREKGVAADRFHAACNGVRWLAAPRLAAVGVSFLLHRENWVQASGLSMRRLAAALGATYVTFRPAIRTAPDQPSVCTDDRGWVTEFLAHASDRELKSVQAVEFDPARFAQYRDWAGHGYDRCLGIRLNTTITPDGRVWVCPQRRGVAGSGLGDLRSESFASIWARHPGHYQVDEGCRVACRLHPVNAQLAALETPRLHEAFI